jgi:hypothetical protein
MNTQKLLITIPDEMRDALRVEAKSRGMSMSAITRLALADWLARAGHFDIPYRVQWGGVRETSSID